MFRLQLLKHYLPLIPKLPGLYFESKAMRKVLPEMRNAPDLDGQVTMGNAELLKILFIGESTISGVGVKSNAEGFAGSLSRRLSDKISKNIDWKVFAKSGFNAKKIAVQIVPNIPDNSADLIVIGIGGNDAFELTHPDNFEADVKTLIKNLKNKFPTTPLVFINFPAVADFPALTPRLKKLMIDWVETLHAKMLKIAATEALVYFDPEIVTFDRWKEKLQLEIEVGELFSDGIHPSKLSYDLWAQIVVDFILRNKIFTVNK